MQQNKSSIRRELRFSIKKQFDSKVFIKRIFDWSQISIKLIFNFSKRSFNREVVFDAITFPQKQESPAELTIQYPLALFSKFIDKFCFRYV